MKPKKTQRRTFFLVAALLGVVTVGVSAQPRAMDRVREFLSEGSFLLDLRARYEKVEQTGTDNANALTMRTRLGYLTRMWRGFTALFEAENVASPFPNNYNQSQLNPNGRDKAIVTDPTGTNVAEAWLQYQHRNTSIKIGRQRLSLDNGRFIGDYDWRQHVQTFDAAVIDNNSFENLSLTYAYIARVNRVFGPRHAQGTYDSKSHLMHASYRGLSAGTLAGYVYLLNFDGNVVGNSCATYGLSFDGERSLSEHWKLGYRAEYARQSDYGKSPLFYTADYLSLEARASYDMITAGFGYESLGSDNNFAFRTPLASLHDFNGWADAFVLTPSQGLRDTYAKLAAQLPWRNIGLQACYHTFDSSGLRLGTELDLQATHQISESLAATVKYASFRRDATMMDDIKKLWLQIDLKY